MPGTPPTSPRLGIPRYAGTDNVDFPAQVNAVSDRVDVIAGRFESGLLANRPITGTGIADRYYWATDTKEMFRDTGGATPTWENVTRRDTPIVTALPGTPYDGQVVLYQPNATDGLLWPLRYRAGSASPYRWEAAGDCAPLTAEAAAAVSTTSTAYLGIDGTTPQAVLPLAGDYRIGFGATLSNSVANNGAFVAARLGAAATVDTDGATHMSATAGADASVWRSIRRNGLAALATVQLFYRATGAGGGTATFVRRNLEVQPLRVS